MSESAAGENQGAPNDLDERLKLERVLRDELAQLRPKPSEGRQRLKEPQLHQSTWSRLRAEISTVSTALRGERPQDSWTKEDENLSDARAEELLKEDLTADQLASLANDHVQQRPR